MVRLPLPRFVANSEDDTRCGPACWRMVLETFFPEQNWPFETIDRVVHKEEGKYTWGLMFWRSLIEAGCRLHLVSTWNNRAFIERGWDYMRERGGEAFMQDQLAHSPSLDVLLEAMRWAEGNENITKEVRPAVLGDIANHLEEGAYVSVLVNGPSLRKAEGTRTHFVLIYGMDGQNIYLQNPGLPPLPEQAVPIDQFLASWSFGQKENYSLTAYYKRAMAA